MGGTACGCIPALGTPNMPGGASGTSLTGLGVQVTPSQANFVFARRPGEDMGPLYEQLRTQGILVRHFPTPQLRDGIRITVGTEEETTALLEALARLTG